MAPTFAWTVFAAALLREGGTLRTKETQLSGEDDEPGNKDLVFVNVPFNLGSSIAEAAAMGPHHHSKHKEVGKVAKGHAGNRSTSRLPSGKVAAGQAGWKMVHDMAQPNAPIWGAMHPDLQEETDYGCPLFETPQQQWPEDEAHKYFNNKTVFGMLRDPYDRWVAAFRGLMNTVTRAVPNLAKGLDFDNDDMTCDVNAWTKLMLAEPTLWPKAVACKLQPQVSFFEGPHKITLPVDFRKFPDSANRLFKTHGYDNIDMDPNRLTHTTGCDNTWAGDLDDVSKDLIHHYYRRDFDLVCKLLGHCSKHENVCATGVPGACPAKLFSWERKTKTYRRLPHAAP
jgi:hypothetical protein